MQRSLLFPRSFQILAVLGAAAILPFFPVHADDAVQAVQATLKTKGFFYGAPDGNLDLDTHNAIRRFQIHDGLPVNGELDGATAKALGVPSVARPGDAGPSAPPKSPVTRGESAGPPQDADRAFLRQLDEQAPTQRIEVHPTPAPVESSPPSAPPPNIHAAPPARSATSIADVNAFVGKYLVVGASPDIEAEVALYADAVDYFNNGIVNRGFIRRDTNSYRRRWPRRDYLLEGKPAVLKANADGTAITVRFRLRYRVQAGLQSAAGRTESTMELERTRDGRLVIISIKESVLARR